MILVLLGLAFSMAFGALLMLGPLQMLVYPYLLEDFIVIVAKHKDANLPPLLLYSQTDVEEVTVEVTRVED